MQLDRLSKLTDDGIVTQEAHEGNHEHQHDEDKKSGWRAHWDLLLALAILVAVLTLEYRFDYELPNTASLIINLVAYLLAGRSVLNPAFHKGTRGDFFNEFVLVRRKRNNPSMVYC